MLINYMQATQPATTIPALYAESSSCPIDSGDIKKIETWIKGKGLLTKGDFAALCLDFPDLAMRALETYSPSALPKELPARTITTLGFHESHEELLLRLITANMCDNCSTLLHRSCENKYYNAVALLVARGSDLTTQDEFGKTAQEISEKMGDKNLLTLLGKSNQEPK